MIKHLSAFFAAALVTGAAFGAHATPPAAGQPARPQMQFGTTPGAHNDTELRPLSPEEIPPNLNFYAVNPLYQEGALLGWAKERIEEKIDRGVVAVAREDRKVHVSWRLLKSDPANVAFNVYRSTAGATPTKLTSAPIATTTDFVDTGAPLERANIWTVRAVVNGRELEASPARSLSNGPAGAPPVGATVKNYRAIKLKDDVTSISMTTVGDLDKVRSSRSPIFSATGARRSSRSPTANCGSRARRTPPWIVGCALCRIRSIGTA